MNIFRSSLRQFGQWIRQFCRCENVTDSNMHAFTHSVTAQVWPYKKKLKTHQEYLSLPCEVNKDGPPQPAICTVHHPMTEKASSLNILLAYICSALQWFCASETWSSFDRIDENATRVPMPFSTSISLLLSFLTCLGWITTVPSVMTGISCLSSSITLAGFSHATKKNVRAHPVLVLTVIYPRAENCLQNSAEVKLFPMEELICSSNSLIKCSVTGLASIKALSLLKTNLAWWGTKLHPAIAMMLLL